MIAIGLTSWSDHPHLLLENKPTLANYAARLPMIELDTPFYGIPSQATVQAWVQTTPADFRFLIKVHRAITLQGDWQETWETEEQLYIQYLTAMQPMIASGKLAAFLLQFPAFFTCTTKHVAYLQRLRQRFVNYPLAIEFRHASWYAEKYFPDMLTFMRAQKLTLVSVDEPQVPEHSVPFVAVQTTPNLAIFRLHGRNQTGWLAKGPDWRKKRTLYSYSHSELLELAEVIKETAQHTAYTAVIFNNNSGGDAAANALALKEILQLDYTKLNPLQLNLFDE